MPNKISIYKLLAVKPNSTRLWFIMLPPVYALWLMAIGRILLQKQKKSDRFFSIISVGFFLLNLVALLAVALAGTDFFKIPTIVLKQFGFVYFSLFFMLITFLTNLTIKYERNIKPEKLHSIADFRDYIWRFFNFLYWPFYLNSLQQTVKELYLN